MFASIVALWYVSGSVRGAMTAMNTIYGCKETRSWQTRYPLSFGLAAAITLCVVGALLGCWRRPRSLATARWRW